MPKKDSCKVKIRHGKDGSVTKEISGSCTKEQLEALANENVIPSGASELEN